MCKYKTHVLKTHPDTPLGVLNPRKWRQHDRSKQWEPLRQQKSVTSQKTKILILNQFILSFYKKKDREKILSVATKGFLQHISV